VSTSHDTAQTTEAAQDGFDHLIHAPIRLRICATLDPVSEVEFGALLNLLDISKSALSKHISVLADAGYVEQRRAVRDTRLPGPRRRPAPHRRGHSPVAGDGQPRTLA
jgi:DNA-binding MarR family transcriptional regulator